MRNIVCSSLIPIVLDRSESNAIDQVYISTTSTRSLSLQQLDLPEPVVPATNICGALPKSVITGLPENILTHCH